MSKFSNWPSSRPGVTPSSHQENDESLYPSRIARVQLNPKVPRELAERLKLFCLLEGFKLQDVVSEGAELFMAQHYAKTGRPAVQPSSRPVAINDQDLIPDLISENESEIDQNSNSLIPGRPAVQLADATEQILKALEPQFDGQTFATWIKSLTFAANEAGRTVTITAPNYIVRDWVSSKYGHHLEPALAGAGFHGFDIRWEFRVEAKAEAGPEPKVRPRVTAADVEDDLLNFYAVVTDNKIDDKTRSSFRKVHDCSPDSVRSGILRSQLSRKNAGSRVNSFEYCVKPIRQIERAGLGLALVPSLTEELYKQPTLPNVGSFVEGKFTDDK